ncbi:uncharacterized protein ColSpa_05669 [Colletotrichum spaethianum]|uniref:Tryptophan synthase beta chain-like PALP domain-containing protein n=1 Tax=Colletotrichum spaethianum TaxID=700344 RepID=A0AA37P1X3_9PEZI|nr:uncharacterized protein ColSpa_05669 [Colletotrichum spaethianum]GKT45488.1 hypothetical protein ColSpa_05669 [Colletotrichum spaethianum]
MFGRNLNAIKKPVPSSFEDHSTRCSRQPRQSSSPRRPATTPLAFCRAAKAALSVTVSELKAKRILAEADEVIFYGHDLAGATTEAIRIEELSAIGSMIGEPMVKYVSPYDDLHVAAGAGTLMSEAFEDAGAFDQVILPLRGGGLTAALVRPTQFADILDSHVDKVVEVSEDAVLAGIALSLRHQSLLIEGSSGAAIFAITHANSLLHDLRGKTLALLTGGNLSSNNVACALVADVADPTARQQNALRNITNPSNSNGALDKLARKAPVEGLLTSNGSAAVLKKNQVDASVTKAKTLPEGVMDGPCDGFDERIAILHNFVSHRRQLSRQLELDIDCLSEDVLGDMVARTQRMILELRDALVRREEPLWVLEEP